MSSEFNKNKNKNKNNFRINPVSLFLIFSFCTANYSNLSTSTDDIHGSVTMTSLLQILPSLWLSLSQADSDYLTIELPKNVIDSKGASNDDTKFQVKIDSKGVDYKEIANNVNSRILSIDFSKTINLRK